jgi:mRNA-degrading endonuclease RelE of RelBE toxin-antitoxin system
MSYDLSFSALASKKLKKMDKRNASYILKRLEKVANSPAHFLEPLYRIDAYKVRAGDYRIIVQCNQEQETLFVMTLGDRSTIYKEIQRLKI